MLQLRQTLKYALFSAILATATACGAGNPLVDLLHPPSSIAPDREQMRQRIRDAAGITPRVTPDTAGPNLTAVISAAALCVTDAWTEPATPDDLLLANEYQWATAAASASDRELILQRLTPDCAAAWAGADSPHLFRGRPPPDRGRTPAIAADHPLAQELARCLRPGEYRPETGPAPDAAHYLTVFPAPAREPVARLLCASALSTP